eukprot:TRINITY_DN2941_c0_g1_i10.p2 TRINITY_DN2941_c0_g1~~TRINITY_DN2941_c0_g1_i10.p2  ORF type:complete len:400 (+),score=125.73 TRINITY_DN2941_c0_g1_i10:813-2012(+)
MSRAHEKMLREVYMQKLARQKEHKAAAKELAELKEEAAGLRNAARERDALRAELQQLRDAAPQGRGSTSPPAAAAPAASSTPASRALVPSAGAAPASAAAPSTAGYRSAMLPSGIERRCFALRCACDIFGAKRNIRLLFNHRPMLTEALQAMELHLDISVRSMRPPSTPDIPFSLAAVQVHDPARRTWDDLVSEQQLHEDCQLFVFQPESPWHPDCAGAVPAPADVVAVTPTGRPPPRSISAEAAPAPSERTHIVFQMLDVGRAQHVLIADWEQGLQRAGLCLRGSTPAELFLRADHDSDGRLSYGEWLSLARQHPHLVDALFFKLRDAAAAGGRGPGPRYDPAPQLQQRSPYSPTSPGFVAPPSERERYESLAAAQQDTAEGMRRRAALARRSPPALF